MTLHGGRAPQYLSDVIIRLTSRSSEYEKANLGKKVEYETLKSRFGRGKCKIPFYICFGKGIAMIPTYAEVLDKVDTTFQGKPVKMMELKAGGYGSLYLNDIEYKFRGDRQLYPLITEHWKEIKEIVPWTMFAVPEAEDTESMGLEPTAEQLKQYSSSDNKISQELDADIPKALRGIKYDYKSKENILFRKGVDDLNQMYYLQYFIKTKVLQLEYGKDTKKEITNPKKSDYDKLNKELDEYLEKVEEEQKDES